MAKYKVYRNITPGHEQWYYFISPTGDILQYNSDARKVTVRLSTDRLAPDTIAHIQNQPGVYIPHWEDCDIETSIEDTPVLRAQLNAELTGLIAQRKLHAKFNPAASGVYTNNSGNCFLYDPTKPVADQWYAIKRWVDHQVGGDVDVYYVEKMSEPLPPDEIKQLRSIEAFNNVDVRILNAAARNNFQAFNANIRNFRLNVPFNRGAAAFNLLTDVFKAENLAVSFCYAWRGYVFEKAVRTNEEGEEITSYTAVGKLDRLTNQIQAFASLQEEGKARALANTVINNDVFDTIELIDYAVVRKQIAPLLPNRPEYQNPTTVEQIKKIFGPHDLSGKLFLTPSKKVIFQPMVLKNHGRKWAWTKNEYADVKPVCIGTWDGELRERTDAEIDHDALDPVRDRKVIEDFKIKYGLDSTDAEEELKNYSTSLVTLAFEKNTSMTFGFEKPEAEYIQFGADLPALKWSSRFERLFQARKLEEEVRVDDGNFFEALNDAGADPNARTIKLDAQSVKDRLMADPNMYRNTRLKGNANDVVDIVHHITTRSGNQVSFHATFDSTTKELVVPLHTNAGIVKEMNNYEKIDVEVDAVARTFYGQKVGAVLSRYNEEELNYFKERFLKKLGFEKTIDGKFEKDILDRDTNLPTGQKETVDLADTSKYLIIFKSSLEKINYLKANDPNINSGPRMP